MLMLEDLYKIQLYKIYYKNVKNFLPEYFQTFTPCYSTATDHNHGLRHTTVRLPMTKREYYVQCTKYQYLKLIQETSQLDLDRCCFNYYLIHSTFQIYYHCSIQPSVQQKKLLCLRTTTVNDHYFMTIY